MLHVHSLCSFVRLTKVFTSHCPYVTTQVPLRSVCENIRWIRGGNQGWYHWHEATLMQCFPNNPQHESQIASCATNGSACVDTQNPAPNDISIIEKKYEYQKLYRWSFIIHWLSKLIYVPLMTSVQIILVQDLVLKSLGGLQAVLDRN